MRNDSKNKSSYHEGEYQQRGGSHAQNIPEKKDIWISDDSNSQFLEIKSRIRMPVPLGIEVIEIDLYLKRRPPITPNQIQSNELVWQNGEQVLILRFSV